MSLNYFVSCKKLTEDNMLYIDKMICNYYTMYTDLLKLYDCMSDCQETPHYNNILRLMQECVNKKMEQENLLKIFQERIYKLCQHHFVEDDIDTSPETSQKITYCTICESSRRESL
jgi:hypothetical protein